MSTYPIIKCAMCNRSLHEDMERNARIATLEAALAAATKRAEEAEAENKRLIGGDIKRLCIEAGHIEADIHDGIGVKIFAHMIGEYFRKAGAVNFAAVDLIDNSNPDDPLMLQVVVQRKGGKSPAEHIAELDTALSVEREAVRVLRDTARLCAARLSNAYDRMDLAEVTKNPWLASAITHAIQDLQATNSPAALAEAAQQAKKENGNGN